jgi:lipopolysaccharide/colanic/teichoic acid biosynthesis glycosyltransferase
MIYWINQYAITPDSPGGTRHYEMARFSADLGQKITIIASDLNLYTRQYKIREPNNRNSISQIINNIEFIWLFASGYQKNDVKRTLSMLSFSFYVFIYLVGVKTDKKTVFIGSSPHLFAALATQFAAWLRGAPFILEVRDLWPETLIDMTGKKNLQSSILRLIANYLYKTAKKIIVLAHASKGHISSLGFDQGKIVYIPNGIDTQTFEFLEKPSSPMLLPNGKKIFVYTGAHGPANDLETVLYAFAELQKQKRDDIHGLLVGDGPSKQQLLVLAQELKLQNVTFHDPIQKQDIPALLQNVDAGLLILKDAPVFRYGISPNKLFDYMASGLPILANVAGDTELMIAEAGSGITVTPQNSEALAKGMIEMIEQLQEKPQMGQLGIKFVAKNHNRSILAKTLIETIESAIQTPEERSSKELSKNNFIKRLFDITSASLGLLILSPVLLCLIFLIRRSLGSPVLFSQKRPGLNGNIFTMYKFRTMTDARDSTGQLLSDSERLTAFGRWLRASSLDELPELWNVLCGDMSLVGPRPLLTEYLELYDSQQAQRHNVKPGITGWAQVNGRNAISWQEKFKLDLWYVDNWSLSLDLKIIWKTILKVIQREGISADGEATMPKFTGNDS